MIIYSTIFNELAIKDHVKSIFGKLAESNRPQSPEKRPWPDSFQAWRKWALILVFFSEKKSRARTQTAQAVRIIKTIWRWLRKAPLMTFSYFMLGFSCGRLGLEIKSRLWYGTWRLQKAHQCQTVKSLEASLCSAKEKEKAIFVAIWWLLRTQKNQWKFCSGFWIQGCSIFPADGGRVRRFLLSWEIEVSRKLVQDTLQRQS